MPIITVQTEAELVKVLGETEGACALEFVANGCGHCEAEIPEVNNLVNECPGITVVRANADTLVAAADRYLGDEGGTPTIFYSKKGGAALAAVKDAKDASKFELDDSIALRRRLKCARKKAR